MPYKIIHKQIGWRNSPLRGYSRPKFGHVLTTKAAEFVSPLSKRAKSKEAFKLIAALLLVSVFLILMDLFT
jgi:hypothetical protein